MRGSYFGYVLVLEHLDESSLKVTTQEASGSKRPAVQLDTNKVVQMPFQESIGNVNLREH